MPGRRARLLRFKVVNLGCKVNRVESDAFERQLAGSGMTPCASDADIVVVNTCTVTAVAEKKTRKAVRQSLAANPRAKVVVTGCAAVQDPSVYAGMSDRVEVVAKWDLEKRLGALAEEAVRTDAVPAHGTPGSPCGPGGALLPSCDASRSFLALGRARVGIKVQDGCANECAYCIVHKLRGPEVSTDPQSVLDDAHEAASLGASEIVLAGINLGRYDFGGLRLDGLLSLLLDEGPDCRIRLSSIEPDNLDDAILRVVASSDGRICRHFHLPLQSGSSKVLREMGRRYSAEDFVDLVAKVRALMPSASISTDVIAGFPGETEDDFMRTFEVCEACGFSKMHVFPYSEREGTPAAARADQVSRDVRLRRAEALRELGARLRKADLASRRGSVELAVVEDETWCTTESYHDVHAPAGAAPGALVEVTL